MRLSVFRDYVYHFFERIFGHQDVPVLHIEMEWRQKESFEALGELVNIRLRKIAKIVLQFITPLAA